MDVISYPFRFLQNGSVAKVVQGSDADLAQKLVALLQTEQGELPLAPHYGVPDPVFYTVSQSEIVAAASIFYPEIKINEITTQTTESGRASVDISFTAADQGDQNAES